MDTKTHLWTSSILAVLLYQIFGLNVIFILIGGVLIDIDHYIWFIFRFKSLSMRECFNHFTVYSFKNDCKYLRGCMLIFHTLEFLILMAIASLYMDIAYMFLIGLSLHMLLDLIWHYNALKRWNADYSIILWASKKIIQKQRES